MSSGHDMGEIIGIDRLGLKCMRHLQMPKWKRSANFSEVGKTTPIPCSLSLNLEKGSTVSHQDTKAK
jgi:hypothetical protein